jgi:hypothetical protein
MGRKPIVESFTLHTDIDLTQASWESDATNVKNIDFLCYAIKWASLVGAGSIQLQGGIKDVQNQQAVIQWFDLDIDPIPVDAAIAANNTDGITVQCQGFEFVRLVYTKDDATDGTLNVYLRGTTVGA